MTLLEFARHAVTDLTFKLGGRSWAGVDCWGLVYLAYREVYGIELPTYSEDYDDRVTYGELAALIERNKAPWTPVLKPQDGDAVLYNVGKYGTHIGLIVEGKLLHCERGLNTVLEPINSPVWGPRIEGYYRHDG